MKLPTVVMFVHVCKTEVSAAPVATFIVQTDTLKYVYALTQLPTMSFERTPVLLHEATYCRYVCTCVKLKLVQYL